MKNRYQKPTIKVVEMAHRKRLLSGSVRSTGIGYRGIDEEGELDPEQCVHKSLTSLSMINRQKGDL